MEHRVALVTSPRSGVEVEWLAKERPVWLIRTPEHEAIAKRVRASGAAITVFNGQGGSPEDELVEIFDVVDEHHPQVREVEVLGASLSPEVRAALKAFGFSRLEESPRGFVAYRD